MKMYPHKTNTAAPFDVRKGSAFPATLILNSGEAAPRPLAARHSLAAERRPWPPETRSLSAHQAAKSQKVYSFRWAAIVVLMLLSSPLLAQQQKPRVFLLNAQELAKTRRRIQSGDKTFGA